MSIEEARAALYVEISQWGNKHPGYLVKAFEALMDEKFARLSPAPVGGEDEHCDCFGDSGLHASTHARVGSPHRHCDMCGKPVADGTVSAIDAVNIPATPPPAEPDGGDADNPDDWGASGAKWAAAFRQMAIKLGYSDMDEGWLIGWFANAIERGRVAHPDTKRERATIAERDRRIADLEAGLADADRDRDYWHRKWLALSPATDKGGE